MNGPGSYLDKVSAHTPDIGRSRCIARTVRKCEEETFARRATVSDHGYFGRECRG